MNQLKQLKSELKEERDKLRKIMDDVLRNKNACRTKDSSKLTEKDECVISSFKQASRLERTKISSLKKGISACEEAVEQERKRILEIIDKLREVRGNDNSLILITFGDDFSTNSVEMMRTKLKQQIEGEK